ncbi:HAUS augmin-like complex subunit 7 [Pseudophryne corroboree]|uniref:HAUS augmin-like complex subunit 7 n=1 Tax=Pseudophryne corroboree TaxID=495146 RepID=UPI0030817CEB
MAGDAELRKAVCLYERLQKLSCPSLEGVYITEPQSIHELLCTPSVRRLDVLEWICTRLAHVVSSCSAVSCARENEEFLRELFSSAHFQATLTPECNPWPADLKPNLLTEEQQKRTVPADKDNVITDYLEELQKITMDLQDLKEECTFLCSAVPGGDTVTQTLRLALTDFHQLITAFTEVYENEFHEHCGHLAPQISSSGPLFQSIHSLLGICIKKLEAIAQFTETSNTIVEVVRKRQQCKESWGGSSAATLYEKIQELKQNYEVFRRPWQE